MDLAPYVDALHRDLTAAVSLGDEGARQAGERLLLALDPAIRMTLLQALSDATAEVSRRLEGTAAVDVRMDGRDARLVVARSAESPEPAPAPLPVAVPSPTTPDEEDGTARMTLRLPESLKAAADDHAAETGVSLNAWLVSAVRAAVERDDAVLPGRRGYATPSTRRGRSRTDHRLTGWA